MVIGFVDLFANYPIMCLSGSWTTREITGAQCLEMAINANANNNGFMLIPTNTNNSVGYTIVTFKINDNYAYLADEDSGLTISGYSDNYIGFKQNSDISRPDLRGIRLSGRSGINPSYSGNMNGTSKVYDDVNYLFFVYNSYSSAPIHPMIYLPSSVTDIYVNNQPLITYVWTSVPAITGAKGTYNLTRLKDEFIDDQGGTDRPISDILSFASSSSIKNFAEAIELNEERNFIISGENNPVTVRKYITTIPLVGDVTFAELKFYQGGILRLTMTAPVSHVDDSLLGFDVDSENEVAYPVIIVRASGLVTYNGVASDDTVLNNMYQWLIAGYSDGSDDSLDNLDNEDTGGDTWNPLIDVPIDAPEAPTVDASDIGFTTMYQVTKADLQNLCHELWSDDFIDNIKHFFNDPSEVIVGIMIMPIAGTVEGTAQNIVAGGIDTGISGYRLSKQYVKIDMGSVKIEPETNTFLDFPPYKTASIYLPFCGEHSIDMDDISGKTLHLEYWFDMLTGACNAILSVNGSYKYNFSGQCGVQIPISSADFSRVFSGIVAAANVGLSTISAGFSGAVGGFLLGAAQIAQNIQNAHPSIEYSNGGGAVGQFIALQQPFVKITKSVPLLANKKDDNAGTVETFRQRDFLGKTTFQNLKLANCTGYTKCMSVHLINIPCTETEKSQIETFLKQGVIIQSGTATPELTPTVSGNLVFRFMKTTSENEVIGKIWPTDEGDTLDIEGKLLYDQSISRPVLTIEGDVRGYNYCYAPVFNRFYYISDIKILTGNLQEITLSVDVLQSFKGEAADSYANGILTCRAIVERQQSKGNLYMNDGYMWTQNNKEVITKPFQGGDSAYQNSSGAQVFKRSNNTYILTVAGG